MNKGFRISKIIMSLLLLSSVFTISNQSDVEVLAEENEPTEYIVKEDAYIRDGGNAGKNYNYEDITKAHGAQYENKGYKVINTKHFTTGQIMSVMKFDLPSKADIETNKFDKYEFEFNIFKNADYNNADQDYVFYYSTETNWSETAITWNNRPASIKRDSSDELFTFHINRGYEYENKEDKDKRIVTDITTKVEELVAANQSEITVFVVAKNSANTSMMMHAKETSAAGKQAKIIASSEGINLASLKTFVDEVSSVKAEDYTKESYMIFKNSLDQAKVLIDENSTDLVAIRGAYRSLKAAYQSLEKLVDPNDPDNIAYKKPTRTNLSKSLSANVTDGDLSTSWSGVFFPAYVDIDLMDTYDLTKLKIYAPVGKKTYYTIYGSNDGENYDRLYQRREALAATADGDTIAFDTPESYRIIRVYMEFTEGDSKAYLSEIRAYGSKTKTNTETLRDGTLEEILDVEAYNDTSYAAPITDAETIENVYGIIDRTIGAEYRSWFSFEITDANSENDFYELSDKGGKVHIKGNEGLSLTTGLNYYFKNFVNVHVSEQAMQTNMPNNIVTIGKTVRKETPYQVRYAFNYCTLNYTFSFFGVEEWQRENDWLALNGVNVVLDLAGQEATWIKFLMNYGYSYDDAKDWLTGPSYYAWQFMDNMESFGGPVPDGYVKDRLELARSSQRWKNSLGMQTVLQGYAGMVPTNFGEYQPDVSIIKQGRWNGFDRPDMIATDSAEYDSYAKEFYKAQEFVYGATSDYYAVDPFHEGGIRPSGLTDDIIAKEVLESLIQYDDNAVWVVQGWQSNPTNALLKGMGEYREDHVLIVDLIKYPIKSWTKYNQLKYGSTTLDSVEFNGTSWAWCLLGNFGGNPSMNGQMDVMVEDILKAQKTSKHMQGIGIISEATYDNPVLYDLIFDLAWADEDFNLDKWLDKYIERRYGGISENAKLAWKTMRNSNYNHGVRFTNEVFGTKNKAPQNYGTQDIPYGADKLETAFKLLAEDYDKFKDSESYRYDMTEIMRQVVSNYAVLAYNDVLAAKNAGSLEDFVVAKDKFLETFDILNEVQSTQKEQLGGEWIGKATDLAANYDDFSKDTFEMNAKTLITTWGSRSGHGSLKDYGWRNYEGIFLDVYKNNWSVYLDKVEKNLRDGSAIQNISVGGYFDIYWAWVMGEQDYTRDPKDSPEEVRSVIDKVLENCSLTEGLDPNAGNIALKKPIEVNAKVEGKAYQSNDGDPETVLTASAKMKDGKVIKPEIIVNLVAEFQLSKINLALDNKNDVYYHYEVYGSADGKEWKKIGEKVSDDLHEDTGDVIPVENAIVRYIKIVGTKDSKHLEDEAKTEIKVKEIRVYGERMLPELNQLSSMVDVIKKLVLDPNTSSQIKKVNEMLEEAVAAVDRLAPPDEVNNIYWSLYDYVASLDLTGRSNVALDKTVTAHNDPSGNSKNLVDGSSDTKWDSGRLSPPGKPYVHDPIAPGWAIIDLNDVYDIDEIGITFESSSLWYQYEVYGSLDGEKWTLLGEKKTETIPNKKEDTHYIDSVSVRYLKLSTTNIKNESSTKRSGYSVRELQAFGVLHVAVDKNELEALVNDVEELKESEYTPNSWSKLEEAIATAKTVLENDEAKQDDVDEALSSLQGIVDKLVKRANITDLNKLIDQISSLKQTDYTPNSWSLLADPLSKAQAVVVNENATQTEVDTAKTSLQEAKDKLVKRADKKELVALISEAEAKVEDLYTPDSWNQLQVVLNKVKAILEDENTTQEVVAATIIELQTAIDKLESANPDVQFRILKSADESIIVSGMMHQDVSLVGTKYDSNQVILERIKDQTFHNTYVMEEAYAIDLTLNNLKYEPLDTMDVQIKMDEKFKNKDISIAYVDDEGKVEHLTSTVEDGYISFNTKHFSDYSILSKIETSKEVSKPSGTNTGDTTNTKLLAIICISALLVLGTILKSKNRKV